MYIPLPSRIITRTEAETACHFCCCLLLVFMMLV